jgi:hypothetical protein
MNATKAKKTLWGLFRHCDYPTWLQYVPMGTRVQCPHDHTTNHKHYRDPAVTFSPDCGKVGSVVDFRGFDDDDAGCYVEQLQIRWDDGATAWYRPEIARHFLVEE